MKLTTIIEKDNGRMMTVNTCNFKGGESDKMQLTIMQHDNDSYIDLNKQEAEELRDKINEWLND